jgi:hypothetical protein
VLVTTPPPVEPPPPQPPVITTPEVVIQPNPPAPEVPPKAKHEKGKKTHVADAPKHDAQPKHEAPAKHSPDAVQAKFRAVKAEYTAFKSQYGAVLEERWNSIADEITFGKADKFEKLDAMLDGLRREMGKVKNGG